MPARTPEDVDRLFGEYVNSGRLDDLVALYEPEGSLVQPTGTATGHAALREALGGLLAAKATIRMNVVKVCRAAATWRPSTTSGARRRRGRTARRSR